MLKYLRNIKTKRKDRIDNLIFSKKLTIFNHHRIHVALYFNHRILNNLILGIEKYFYTPRNILHRF